MKSGTKPTKSTAEGIRRLKIGDKIRSLASILPVGLVSRQKYSYLDILDAAVKFITEQVNEAHGNQVKRLEDHIQQLEERCQLYGRLLAKHGAIADEKETKDVENQTDFLLCTPTVFIMQSAPIVDTKDTKPKQFPRHNAPPVFRSSLNPPKILPKIQQRPDNSDNFPKHTVSSSANIHSTEFLNQTFAPEKEAENFVNDCEANDVPILIDLDTLLPVVDEPVPSPTIVVQCNTPLSNQISDQLNASSADHYSGTVPQQVRTHEIDTQTEAASAKNASQEVVRYDKSTSPLCFNNVINNFNESPCQQKKRNRLRSQQTSENNLAPKKRRKFSKKSKNADAVSDILGDKNKQTAKDSSDHVAKQQIVCQGQSAMPNVASRAQEISTCLQSKKKSNKASRLSLLRVEDILQQTNPYSATSQLNSCSARQAKNNSQSFVLPAAELPCPQTSYDNVATSTISSKTTYSPFYATTTTTTDVSSVYNTTTVASQFPTVNSTWSDYLPNFRHINSRAAADSCSYSLTNKVSNSYNSSSAENSYGRTPSSNNNAPRSTSAVFSIDSLQNPSMGNDAFSRLPSTINRQQHQSQNPVKECNPCHPDQLSYQSNDKAVGNMALRDQAFKLPSSTTTGYGYGSVNSNSESRGEMPVFYPYISPVVGKQDCALNCNATTTNVPVVNVGSVIYDDKHSAQHLARPDESVFIVNSGIDLSDSIFESNQRQQQLFEHNSQIQNVGSRGQRYQKSVAQAKLPNANDKTFTTGDLRRTPDTACAHNRNTYNNWITSPNNYNNLPSNNSNKHTASSFKAQNFQIASMIPEPSSANQKHNIFDYSMTKGYSNITTYNSQNFWTSTSTSYQPTLSSDKPVAASFDRRSDNDYWRYNQNSAAVGSSRQSSSHSACDNFMPSFNFSSMHS